MKSPATPLESATARPLVAGLHAVPARSDEPRGFAHFRPPALPTPQPIHGDLPFTVHLGPRLRTRP
jgi:hypothetical protein